MGIRFRRSFKLLPGIRLNLSGSGVSVSLGAKGFHYTIGSKGSRATVSLPGSGLSWTHSSSHSDGRPKNPMVYPSSSHEQYLLESQSIAPIESRSTEEINALSTSDLVPILNRMRGRIRLMWLTCPLVASVFILALRSNVPEIIQLGFFHASLFTLACIALDRYRRSLRIEYELQGIAKTIGIALKDAFDELRDCAKIWNVTAKVFTHDWKRNAGATSLNQRKQLGLSFDRPTGLRGRVSFPAVKTDAEHLYFLPDAVLVAKANSVAALSYGDIAFSNNTIRFIEEDSVPSDAIVVGETWRFLNKKGGPDQRFNGNRRLPICGYGKMEFRSAGGLNCLIHYSNAEAGNQFAKVIKVLAQATSKIDSKAIKNIAVPKAWPSFLFIMLLSTCSVALGFSALYFTKNTVATNFTNTNSAGASLTNAGRSRDPERVVPPQSIVPSATPFQVNPPIDLSQRSKPKPELKNRDVTPSVRSDSSSGGSVQQCIKIENIDDRVDCLEQLQSPNR